MKTSRSTMLAALITCGLGQAHSQLAILTSATPKVPMAVFGSETSTTGSTSSVAPATKTPEPRPLTARWLDLQTMSHAERYRNAAESTGYHLFEDGQQRTLLVGRLKADSEGKYALAFRASSGRYFNWAYADFAGDGITTRGKRPEAFGFYSAAELAEILPAITADYPDFAGYVATSSAGWKFYVRELYLSATPVKQITVEAGSLGIERGLSTEITTFDDDGYITGQRVRIHDAEHLYFDQVGYTNAYFGDIYKPSVFDRGSNFRKNNYRQVFFDKRVNGLVAFSGEYTWQNRTNTLREASTVQVEKTKIADRVRVELYQRLNAITVQGATAPTGAGFSVAAEKTFHKLSGDFGFASIDRRYAGTYGDDRLALSTSFALNGDSYGVGKRVFLHGSLKVNPVLTAFGFYTHDVGQSVLNLNQQGLNGGLSFDLKAAVNSGKRIF